MIIALPKAKQPNQIIQVLNQLIADVGSIFSKSYTETNIKLAMPKFEHRQRYDLVGAFQEMGIIDLFTNSADLSLISKKGDLNVSKIITEAVARIDEEGTKAAAVTAVMMRESAMMPPKNLIDFTVDHTFYYAIVNVPNHLVIFNGVFNL